MPKESSKETLMKIQMDSMLNYLIRECQYSYADALQLVLASDTYHRLVENDMYMNQGTMYVLDDLKQEVGCI